MLCLQEILLSSESNSSREVTDHGDAIEMHASTETNQQQQDQMAVQETSKTSGFVVLASVMAAIGGVLFGYDVGVFFDETFLHLKSDHCITVS